MLSNLTFGVQFASFSIRPKKGFCFLEHLLSNFRYQKQLVIAFMHFLTIFSEITGNFLENLEQLVESPTVIPVVYHL